MPKSQVGVYKPKPRKHKRHERQRIVNPAVLRLGGKRVFQVRKRAVIVLAAELAQLPLQREAVSLVVPHGVHPAVTAGKIVLASVNGVQHLKQRFFPHAGLRAV